MRSRWEWVISPMSCQTKSVTKRESVRESALQVSEVDKWRWKKGMGTGRFEESRAVRMEGGRTSDRNRRWERKKHWCNPGRRGERGEPMLTPLCLSQVGNDGGVSRHEEWETGALKKHNMVISSILLLFSMTTQIHSEVTGTFCFKQAPLHLKQKNE